MSCVALPYLTLVVLAFSHDVTRLKLSIQPLEIEEDVKGSRRRHARC